MRGCGSSASTRDPRESRKRVRKEFLVLMLQACEGRGHCWFLK